MTDPGLESMHTGRLAGHGIKNADAGLHSHPEIGLARISDEPRLRDGRETFLPRPPVHQPLSTYAYLIRHGTALESV